MKQKRNIIGQLQEYPGAHVWYDYEVCCPECERFVKEYGDVTQTDNDGDEHALCVPCGDRVFPPRVGVRAGQVQEDAR